MMDISFEFECPHCGELIEEDIDELPSFDATSDSASDMVGYGDLAIECSNCSRPYTLKIEYGVFGLSISVEDYIASVKVIGEIDQRDSAERDDYAPKDPFGIYQWATYDLDHIQSEYELKTSVIAAFYKVMFTQYFSIVEAYLGDRLIRAVMSDQNALASLTSKNLDWKAEKITIVALGADPNAFKTWIIKNLRQLVYHQFLKVDAYYNAAFGFSIFPDKVTKETLMRSIPIRHDCVHRYGRTVDGKEITVSKEQLTDLASAVDLVVRHTEERMLERYGPVI